MSTKNPIDPASGAIHGSLKSYVTGFGLSIILTLIPYFFVVKNPGLSKVQLLLILLATAIIQLLVQLVFFLHLSTSSEQRWNVLSLIFTVIMVFVLIAGTIWIMYNLNINMMEHVMSGGTKHMQGM